MITSRSLCVPVSQCGALQVVGVEGQNVTLPCRYDASNHGVLPMCWGRGALPSSGCDNQILSSDGSAVKKRTSIRYLLSGDLKQGDISLTILNTTERDAGLYGCRVEIPGWFNDMKSEVRLTMEKSKDFFLGLRQWEQICKMFLQFFCCNLLLHNRSCVIELMVVLKLKSL